jgi:two-component system nitrate/nitrite response regulator NarL
MSVVHGGSGGLAPRSLRVVVAAPTPSLAAGLAALARDDGVVVAAERRQIEGASALDTIDVAVVAAGTAIALEALPDSVPGIVVVGADPVLTDSLTRDGTRAVGVVPADADATTIGAAIRAVAAGLSVHPPDKAVAVGFGDDALDAEPLTAREAEVLESLAQGLSNRAIAARLGISEHTVKFHLASVFGKLGATTRTGAVRRALRRGLIAL